LDDLLPGLSAVAQSQTGDRDVLVDFAVRTTEELDAKYGGGARRVCTCIGGIASSTRAGVWMWDGSASGASFDLNKLLLHEFDSFPVKAAGELL